MMSNMNIVAQDRTAYIVRTVTDTWPLGHEALARIAWEDGHKQACLEHAYSDEAIIADEESIVHLCGQVEDMARRIYKLENPNHNYIAITPVSEFATAQDEIDRLKVRLVRLEAKSAKAGR